MIVKFFSLILLLAFVYVIAGAVFAIAFIVSGYKKVDRSVKGASVIFKLMIFPGCAALWPILLSKWVKAK